MFAHFVEMMIKRAIDAAANGKMVEMNSEDVVVVDLEELNTNRIRFWFGLVLAISSCLFIGSSFIIKKKGLLRLNRAGQQRASLGGHGYLRDWVWWAGFITMGIGEAANFAAYAFAAASLVTPLGALSVLVSAVLAQKYLNERLNLLGKIGCFLCVLGSTIIVIHAPSEGEIDSLDQLGAMLTETSFLIYISFVFVTTFVLITFCAPKYGNSHLLIYVLICSLVGSLSVMACKGLGLALREAFNGNVSQLTNGLFWLFLVSVVASIAVQMNYLNKALDIFDTSLVTPVYYVFFTSFVLIASAVLYKEWNQMRYEDVLGTFCGFFTVIVAIFLLNGFKDFKISLEVLRRHWVQQKTGKGGHKSQKRLVLKKRKPKFKSNTPSDEIESDLVESDSSSTDERRPDRVEGRFRDTFLP